MTGLVLSGGGARGAYQVGVLKAIAELVEKNKVSNPFQVYTGVSAGAINATFMAAYAEDFPQATQKLVDLWGHLTSDQIFYTDAISLGRIGFTWMKELSLGGLSKQVLPGRALLDTTPLGELIKNNIPFSKIMDNIKQGHLKSIAITAVDYKNSSAITFVEGDKNTPHWKRTRRTSELTVLNYEHVMASSSIPLLFPPICIGERYFGDGCVRNVAPCSPAIHLGAQKLIVIGVRRHSSLSAQESSLDEAHSHAPSVARVINLLLNAVLLDGIELDVERMRRMNEMVRRIPSEHHTSLSYKPIDHVWISPSIDIGQLAREKAHRLPRLIRYLLKGLGPLDDASEIISYLLFDPEFCRELIECGYNDGMRNKDEIERILKV